ncbi:MAG: dockerin type I repeat-containing protein [Planctomycetota bacterium]
MRLDSVIGALALLIASCVLLIASYGSAAAQGQGYVFTATSVEGNIGDVCTSYAYLANPGPVQGWTIGICHDGNSATILNVNDGPALALANGGVAADFSTMTILNDGWIGSVIVDLMSVNSIPAGDLIEIHRADYQLTTPGSPGICFCNSLGTPSVLQQVLTAGSALQPTVVCAPPLPDNVAFRRGDANGDGSVSIGDAVRLLNFLFANALPIDCLDAGDLNDDGILDISDTVFLLTYLFQPASTPPPAPGPVDCGPDAILDFFSDCVYPNC